MRVLVAGVVVFQILILFAMADPKPVSIDHLPKIGIAGQSLRVRYRVEPHEDNRILRMVLDGGSFYRSSDEDLAGAEAPVSRTLFYQQIPAGHYSILAVVGRSDGSRVQAEEFVCFAGMDVSC